MLLLLPWPIISACKWCTTSATRASSTIILNPWAKPIIMWPTQTPSRRIYHMSRLAEQPEQSRAARAGHTRFPANSNTYQSENGEKCSRPNHTQLAEPEPCVFLCDSWLIYWRLACQFPPAQPCLLPPRSVWPAVASFCILPYFIVPYCIQPAWSRSQHRCS